MQKTQKIQVATRDFFLSVLDSLDGPIFYERLRSYVSGAPTEIRSFVRNHCNGEKLLRFFKRRKDYFNVTRENSVGSKARQNIKQKKLCAEDKNQKNKDSNKSAKKKQEHSKEDTDPELRRSTSLISSISNSLDSWKSIIEKTRWLEPPPPPNAPLQFDSEVEEQHLKDVALEYFKNYFTTSKCSYTKLRYNNLPKNVREYLKLKYTTHKVHTFLLDNWKIFKLDDDGVVTVMEPDPCDEIVHDVEVTEIDSSMNSPLEESANSINESKLLHVKKSRQKKIGVNKNIYDSEKNKGNESHSFENCDEVKMHFNSVENPNNNVNVCDLEMFTVPSTIMSDVTDDTRVDDENSSNNYCTSKSHPLSANEIYYQTNDKRSEDNVFHVKNCSMSKEGSFDYNLPREKPDEQEVATSKFFLKVLGYLHKPIHYEILRDYASDAPKNIRSFVGKHCREEKLLTFFRRMHCDFNVIEGRYVELKQKNISEPQFKSALLANGINEGNLTFQSVFSSSSDLKRCENLKNDISKKKDYSDVTTGKECTQDNDLPQTVSFSNAEAQDMCATNFDLKPKYSQAWQWQKLRSTQPSGSYFSHDLESFGNEISRDNFAEVDSYDKCDKISLGNSSDGNNFSSGNSEVLDNEDDSYIENFLSNQEKEISNARYFGKVEWSGGLISFPTIGTNGYITNVESLEEKNLEIVSIENKSDASESCCVKVMKLSTELSTVKYFVTILQHKQKSPRIIERIRGNLAQAPENIANYIKSNFRGSNFKMFFISHQKIFCVTKKEVKLQKNYLKQVSELEQSVLNYQNSHKLKCNQCEFPLQEDVLLEHKPKSKIKNSLDGPHTIGRDGFEKSVKPYMKEKDFHCETSLNESTYDSSDISIAIARIVNSFAAEKKTKLLNSSRNIHHNSFEKDPEAPSDLLKNQGNVHSNSDCSEPISEIPYENVTIIQDHSVTHQNFTSGFQNIADRFTNDHSSRNLQVEENSNVAFNNSDLALIYDQYTEYGKDEIFQNFQNSTSRFVCRYFGKEFDQKCNDTYDGCVRNSNDSFELTIEKPVVANLQMKEDEFKRAASFQQDLSPFRNGKSSNEKCTPSDANHNFKVLKDNELAEVKLQKYEINLCLNQSIMSENSSNLPSEVPKPPGDIESFKEHTFSGKILFDEMMSDGSAKKASDCLKYYSSGNSMNSFDNQSEKKANKICLDENIPVCNSESNTCNMIEQSHHPKDDDLGGTKISGDTMNKYSNKRQFIEGNGNLTHETFAGKSSHTKDGKYSTPAKKQSLSYTSQSPPFNSEESFGKKENLITAKYNAVPKNICDIKNITENPHIADSFLKESEFNLPKTTQVQDNGHISNFTPNMNAETYYGSVILITGDAVIAKSLEFGVTIYCLRDAFNCTIHKNNANFCFNDLKIGDIVRCVIVRSSSTFNIMTCIQFSCASTSHSKCSSHSSYFLGQTNDVAIQTDDGNVPNDVLFSTQYRNAACQTTLELSFV